MDMDDNLIIKKTLNDVCEETKDNKKFSFVLKDLEKLSQSRSPTKKSKKNNEKISTQNQSITKTYSDLENNERINASSLRSNVTIISNRGDLAKTKFFIKSSISHDNEDNNHNVLEEESPRREYEKKEKESKTMIRELFNSLNESDLANIKEKFIKSKSISMEKFILIMYEHFQERIIDDDITIGKYYFHKKPFVYCCMNIFSDIDVENSKAINWQGFATFFLSKPFKIENANTNSVSAQFKEYAPVLLKGAKHNNDIDKVFAIPLREQIVCLESKSPNIRIYGAKKLQVDAILTECKDFPVAVEYIPHVQHLITSTFTEKIVAWQLASGQKQFHIAIAQDKIHKCVFPTPHVQTVLKWAPKHQRLFSGSIAGLIHTWDYFKRKEIAFTHAHHDIINDMLLLNNMECFVTCSSDTMLYMWDEASFVRRQTFSGHKKGVLSMAYCEDLKMLLSVGFDHEIHVWNPHVPDLISLIIGHGVPLNKIEIVPDNPCHIVTNDVDGVLKIWDLRTFKCLQTIEKTEGSNTGIHTFTTSTKSILVATKAKSLSYIKEMVDQNLSTTIDSRPATCVLYNNTSNEIVTSHDRDIKIWSAFTGECVRVYKDITFHDITCMTFDTTEKKIILGEAEGKVGIYNYSSFEVVKNMEGHEGQVLNCLFLPKEKYLITSGWDRFIFIHDESNLHQNPPLRLLELDCSHKNEIVTMAASSLTGLIATGSTDCHVKVWDVETCLEVSDFTHTHQIVSIVFIDEINVLLASDTSKVIKMWITRNSLDPKHIFEFVHEKETILQKENDKELELIGDKFKVKSTVMSMIWISDLKFLVTADELGHLRLWDCEDMISHVQKSTKDDKKFKINKKMISLVWSIRAHTDCITSLLFIPSPISLLTSSFDRKVSLWNLEGEKVGGLFQKDKKNVNSNFWRFPIDMKAIQQNKEAQVSVHSDHLKSKYSMGGRPKGFKNNNHEGDQEVSALILPPLNANWEGSRHGVNFDIKGFKMKAMLEAKAKLKTTVVMRPLKPVIKARTLEDLIISSNKEKEEKRKSLSKSVSPVKQRK